MPTARTVVLHILVVVVVGAIRYFLVYGQGRSPAVVERGQRIAWLFEGLHTVYRCALTRPSRATALLAVRKTGSAGGWGVP